MDGADIKTLERVIAKCLYTASKLKRNGCFSQARVADELAGSFASMLSAARKQQAEVNLPRCVCCGTTENLHFDAGSGGPYRCNSFDCMVF